jgi:serine/threonine protein kinase
MLLPHLAASGAARKRFAREAQAVASVVDDHVMAIHCVDEWQGMPFLVMTYSRGVSLQKRLNDSGPLELREVLRIGMQAAKGLAAAHAQGIVHRDIKPSNILLDQNVERVQLVDFGLARAVDDASLTCSGTLAGTPQYMSPEQARAEAVDHRSDLFSLGSVLYAMCAGYAPFRADSSYSVLRLIIEKEPRPIREINSDIPDWLCAIINKLMAKQAVDRFDSAKQVADLLEACLAHVQQPTTVPLPPSVVRLSSIAIPTSDADLTLYISNGNKLRSVWRRFVGPSIGKFLAAAAAAAAIVLAGVVIVLELDKGTLTIKSVADNVPIRIVHGKDTIQELTISKQGATTRLRSGTYTVEIEGDSTAYDIHGDNVTVKRGEDTLVDIIIGRPSVATTLPENSNMIAKPPVDVSKANAASTAANVELLLSNLDFLNSREDRGSNTTRSVRYGRTLMELTKAGSTALPKIIERLDSTEDDRMIASLAFVLRAIGDRRGVPALIRAVPRTPGLSPCNWIDRSQTTAGELDSFFQTHRFEGQGDAGIGCSNSEIELSMALGTLTNAKFPISRTYGSGTERQVYLQRQVLYKDAKQWADWWEQNSSRLVDDEAYAKVELPPFTMTKPEPVDPNQLLDKLPWNTVNELPALQSAGTPSNGYFPRAFLDLDTDHSEAIPKSLRDKQLSEMERADLLVWAEKEGFDLICDQIGAKDSSTQYVLRGVGLKAWQIEDKWWTGGGFESASWSEMAKNGRALTDDRLIPYVKDTDERDPAAMGLFLFVTREGTPGWIYVGAQVTEGPDTSGVLSADWLHDKRGLVKGRKLGLQFFRENDSTKNNPERIINGWPVPNTIESPTFPPEMHGNWRIQDAMTLTSKRPEYIDEVVVIDDKSLLLTSGEHSNRYRLSYWKHRDDNQSIEVDLTAKSPDGNESKTFRCLMEIQGDVLTLLRQQNEHFPRPKSIDDISTSITRFTLVREKSGDKPTIYSPLEAIEISKRFANDDHGSAIRVKFRVESVHPSFVSGNDANFGHAKTGVYLDFRKLPTNFAEDQFLVVLTNEVIAQLKNLGIEDVELHFLNKEIEATGRVLSTMYTARGMRGDHFHLIVSDLKQIAFSKEQREPENKVSNRFNVEIIEIDRLKLAQNGIDLDLGDVDSQSSLISLKNAESFRALVRSLETKGLAAKVLSLSKRIASEQSGTMTAKIDPREFNLSLRPHIKLNAYTADLELRVTEPDLTSPEKTLTRSAEFDCEGKPDEILAMNVTKLFADDSNSKLVILLLTIDQRTNDALLPQ